MSLSPPPSGWTDEHDALLRHAAPSTPEVTESDLAAVWARVQSRTGPAPTRTGRRSLGARGLRGALAAVVVAGAVGASGVAAADLVGGARTGTAPSDPEGLRLAGPGEWLDLSGTDLRRVIDEETTDIVFPDDDLRRTSLDRHAVENTAEGGPGAELATVGAFRAWVATDAVCAWTDRWAVAVRSDQDAVREQAASMVRAAPTWPAVTAIDPAPYHRWRTMDVRMPDGTVRQQRYLDDSQFAWLGPLAAGVEGSDVGAVARDLHEAGRCRPDMVPHLPTADPSRGDPGRDR